MEAPIYVRSLTEAERQHIHNALRSSDAFTLRRAQIIRASADGQTAKPIAKALGCSVQSVRNAIRAFNETGLDCLKKQSSRPKTVQSVFAAEKQERLQHLLHQSPRVFGQAKSVWTLPLLVTVCQQEGLTEQPVSEETVRRALKRFGWNWKRAKTWINSPDPAYDRKKKRRDWLIALCRKRPDWALGFQDEVWFSRMAQPHLRAWAKEKPLPLLERDADASDKEAKALACYGVFVPEKPQMYLRFVDGRPVSDVTCQFSDWIAREMAAQQKTALLLIWDNASWHKSGLVKDWLKAHNRRVKREGGCRLLCCPLPSKSPWLNNIEPKWAHGKRAIAEPERKLTLLEIKERLCAYYQCEALEPLAQKVA